MGFSVKNFIVIVFFSLVTFSVSNYLLEGSLSSEQSLGGELKSPPDSLYQWRIGEEAPFKYRALHRAIVLNTYHLLKGQEEDNALFFQIYRVYSLAFQTLAVFLFYLFLLKLDLGRGALAGAILFSLLPPFLLAYNLPVHTREDMLAYSLLLLGILAVLDNHISGLIVITFFGVLCRETLLIIPFLNFFFNRRQGIAWRLSMAAIGFAVFFFLRFYIGITSYDYWEGLTWNVNNIEQVIGFSFITFGVLWIPFLLSFFRKQTDQKPIDLMYKSAPYVFLLIVATTFLGGIFNEIRLLYLLAPWVIAISIHFTLIHWDQLKHLFQSKWYQLFIVISFALLAMITQYAVVHVTTYIPQSKYAISYSAWIVAAMVQLYFVLIFIPFFVQLKISTKQSNAI